MRFLTVILCAFSFAITVGCASGPAYSAAAPRASTDLALIYIYRMPEFAGFFGGPHIYVQERKYGSLVSDGFFVAEVKPGELEIYARSHKYWEPPSQSIKLDAKAGEKYYIRYGLNLVKYEPYFLQFEYGSNLALMKTDVGLKEISDRNLISPD